MKTIDSQAEAPESRAVSRKGKKLFLSVHAPIEAADEAEPGSHLKRIFVVLLLVHVFLVGGIILYNCLKQDTKSQIVESTAPQKKPVVARTLATAAVAKPSKPLAPAGPSDEDYVIKHGDTLKGIAESHHVDEADVCAINGISPSAALEPGTVLRFPKKAPPAPVKAPEPAVVAEAPPAPKPEPRIASAPPVNAQKPDTAAQAKLVKHEVSQDAPPSPKAVIVPAPPAAATQDKPPGPLKTATPEVAGSTPPKPQPKAAEKPADKPVAKAKEESKPKEEAKPKPAKDEPAKTEKAVAKVRSYTVNPKETFYSISKKFGVNVNELMKLNNVKDPGKLHEGTKLKIPAKAAP
jgi:LysM repeat protein